MRDALRSVFLPAAAQQDDESLRRGVRLVAFNLAMLLWVPVFVAVYWLLDAPTPALIVASAGICVLGNLLLYRQTAAVCLCGNIVAGIAWTTYTAIACTVGGHGTPPTWWYATVPVLAILLAGMRAGLIWSVLSVAAMLAFYVTSLLQIPVRNELSAHALQVLQFSALVGLTLCLHVLTWVLSGVETRARGRLAVALDQAHQADRTKSEFLANMSHEIRTPMTAILGYTDLILERGLEGEAAREALETVRRNGAHLLAVINDILDLSSIEAGKLRVEHVICDPRQLALDAAQLMQPRATAKGLSLTTEFDDQLPRQVLTDPTRLRQVVLNLLGNAIKFTESGWVRLSMNWQLNAAASEGQLEVRIADSGIGMADEELQHLFQPFNQADTSMARRFGGTGLGLAISRRLARLLGGDITVRSKPGQGATFFVCIPARQGSPEPASNEPSPAPRDGVPQTPANSPCDRALVGVRLLLAEDSPDNQRLIGHVLRRAGAEVAFADNGAAACELAMKAVTSESPFDVVLMDMQMPLLDGYEATMRLRRQGYVRPILALTAHSMETDRQKCLDAGCDDYATKPIDRAALIDIIRRLAVRETSAA